MHLKEDTKMLGARGGGGGERVQSFAKSGKVSWKML